MLPKVAPAINVNMIYKRENFTDTPEVCVIYGNTPGHN
jgi:hypothetical protein